MRKVSATLLLFLGLAMFLAVGSASCSDHKDCITCLGNASEKCSFCPSSRACSGDGQCGVFQINRTDNCPINQPLCGTATCPAGAICNFLATPPVCICANCTAKDDKGQCSIPRCDSNTMGCELDRCVCKPGLTPVMDGDKLVCKDLSCGKWTSGCGPQSTCSSQDCKCNDGYIIDPNVKLDGLVVHPGCILAPKTCAETCTFPNAVCVDERCQCKAGFVPNLVNKTCDPLPPPPADINCAINADCKSCNVVAGCLWCQAEGQGSCILNSVNITCSGRPFFSPEQCGCLGGCGDNQVCTLTGCACMKGFEFVNGACRDPLNPCGGVTCKENEECKNEFSSTINTTFPICRCVSGFVRVNDRCVAQTNSCDDPTSCRCVTIEALSTQVCCQPPFEVDKEKASCRIKCFDGSFADTIADCPCDKGLVHDLGTELCTKPCPDGSAPSYGKCGTVQCPDGQSPNPTYVPGSQDPPCGFVCPSGTFVLYKEKCFEECAKNPQFYCPCPEKTVHDLITKACVEPCPNGLPPSDSKCPERNNCPEGVPFPEGDRVVCKRPCPGGTYVLLTEACPLSPCPDDFVRDKATLACVSPCASGAAPYNGNCPVTCTNLVDCCASLGDPSRCPPPECEAGKKRNAEGVCVTPCSDGSLPNLKDGSCTSANCSLPGQVKGPNNECGFYCNSTLFVKDPAKCCPSGQVFSPATQKCLCRDGSIAVEGKCATVSCEGSACPCPAPLVRNPKTLKCECPDPKTYPDPFDGRRCGASACPPGLVQLDSSCVCPITGLLPEKRSVDGRDVIFCPCDPAKYEKCPLTPLNCEGSSFPKCDCLTDPSKDGCQTYSVPTKESCLSYPSDPRCFCLLRPTAQECLTAPKCALNPEDPACVTGAACTREKVLKGECSREEFCKANPNATECTCFKAGGCSQAGINFAANVSFSDLKNAECSEADFRNRSNLACYCAKSFDPRLCYCALFPSDPKCLNPDGSAQVPSAEVFRNSSCKVVNQVAGAVTDQAPCRRNQTFTDHDDDVNVHLEEGNNLLKDQVSVNVKKGGDNPGFLTLNRSCTKGEGAPPGASVNDSNISVNVGFAVTRCFEFSDVNLDGLVSDGDSIVSELLFKDLSWTTTSFTNDEGYTTITLTSEDGQITLTYVISNDQTSLGEEATTKPPRNTKFTLEINYPYELTTTNLACDAKIVTAVSATFSNNVLNLGGRAQFKFETSASSGSTVVPVLLTMADTTSADVALTMGAHDKVFTVTFVAQGWAIPNLRYDPDLTTSSSPATASNFEKTPTPAPPTPAPTTPTTQSAAFALSPLFSLALASCLAVLFASF